ncbi:MAG: hypothetical protein ABEJ92_08400 [Halobacteriales archaeon]
MSGDLLFTLSVSYALITGTAAGILSLQTYEFLRRSPFGRAVSVLSLVMLVFIVYHVVLLLFPTPPPVATAIKSLLFTGVAVFVGLMIRSQRRMRARAAAGGGG